TLDGKFCARLRCKNLEIHKVFLRFLRLGGHKICSPIARVDFISVSLKIVTGWLAFHEEEAYKAWNLAVQGEHFEIIPPMN
ncbi:MAG: hypothetical protein IJU29_09665, partial [Oscillospiraceae bacterium]|nr:hypothetical protein [Oscillospiraceae bacterium]